MFLNKADKNCGTESSELITSEEEKPSYNILNHRKLMKSSF